jgi:hypothetical protein
MLDKFCYDVSVGRQRANCSLFVFTHEATVTFDIGTEDGGELAFKTFLRHRKSTFWRFQNENASKYGVL